MIPLNALTDALPGTSAKNDDVPDDTPRREWHKQSAQQSLETLNSNAEHGLSDEDVTRRLNQYGRNELIERGTKPVWRLFYEQLVEPLVIILLIAALISALLGKQAELVAIMAIVVLNAVLGVFQEYRAEQAIAALKKMSQPLVRIRRNGKLQDVEASQIVPGDIVLLEAGNIIPADARILESKNLRVQEASLTGESYPVDKTEKRLSGENLPVGDRTNMLYMGTSVAYGRGEALIVETGMQTQLGRIADMLQSVGGDKSPLQKRMSELGRVLFAAAFVVMGLSFLIGLITNTAMQVVLLNSVAIAVAVVPEGLPAVVTISLALGAQRMLRRNALIRKLPAVETLGSVTVIASDKTGTLTENRMTVKVIDVAGNTLDTTQAMQSGSREPLPNDPAQVLLLLSSALANDSTLQQNPEKPSQQEVIGDPTEGALMLAADHYSLTPSLLEQQFPRVAEVPFSSERKRMTTIHDNTGGQLHLLDEYLHEYVAFTKGAQQADTGTKMTHIGKNTRSTIISKGISGGVSNNSYRGLVKINKGAENARNFSQCDSLLLGDKCGAHTFPYIEVKNNTAQVEHEATTSKVGEDQIFYCNQRGIGESDAVKLIVSGFCQEILAELPMEFAVEAKKLLSIELEGSVG